VNFIVFSKLRLKIAKKRNLNYFFLRKVLAPLFLIFHSILILLLTGDLLDNGIPILKGLDRREFIESASIFNSFLLEKQYLIFASLGIMFLCPKLVGKGFDGRFFIIFILYNIFFILTGHRFSIFFSSLSFFILPLSTLFILPYWYVNQTNLKLERGSRFFSFFCSSLGISIIFLLIYNSIVNVRAYTDLLGYMEQRALIQQGQLWVLSQDNINIFRAPYNEFLDFLKTPLRNDTNSSIQWLMVKSIGAERAGFLILNGQNYAGGFPEILTSFTSSFGLLVVVASISYLSAILLRFLLTSIFNFKILTTLSGLAVYFAFCLFFSSGMINCFFQITYFFKILIFITFIFGENFIIKIAKL
jgi:hypothetical protein